MLPPVQDDPLVPLEPVESWADLKDRLRDQRGWIFRGECSTEWHLRCSLERSVAASKRLTTESDLLFRYQQAAGTYLSSAQIPRLRLDWFASMQHHGAPTRLLDFTRSPYVAMYFAVEDASGPCVVWAVDEQWCRSRALERLRASSANDANLTDQEQLVHWIYGTQGPWMPCLLAMPAGPMQMSARLIAQQAIFLLPGDLSSSFEDNLRANADTEDELRAHVKRYNIPAIQKGEILNDLRLMNVSRASLFPGLDGFAQSLKYSLTDEDVSQWTSRQAMRSLRDIVYNDHGE
jgi:hypothetical protein